MKHIKHWLATIAVLLCCLTASAQDFQVDGIFYSVISNSTVSVTYLGSHSDHYPDEYSGNVIIPSFVSYRNTEFKVIKIGSSAFNGCSGLTSITIPESVTSISDYAFKDCSSLTTITIPEESKLTSIGDYAFENCSNLTSISIPEGVTSIGRSAFNGCCDLVTIVLPKSVKYIYEEAFANCGRGLYMYCYAEVSPQETSVNAFGNSSLDYATLLVPANALENYKTTIPWNRFNTIAAIGSSIFNMKLSQSLVTLFEGESLYLTLSLVPDNAKMDLVSWSSSNTGVVSVDANGGVTAVAPGRATIIAMANDVGGVTASCEVTVFPSSIKFSRNQYGSATYCSEYALDFSEVEGLKAYAATGFDTETGVVTLSRVMTAKAGVGLFIKGGPGNYEVPVLENTSFNTLNMLVGTSEAVTLERTSEDGLYVNYKYTLSDDNATPQFYVFDDGFTLGAGKAYLQVPATWVQTEARAISLRFDDGETTDIEKSELEIENSTIIFDLMGRRVENPVKGGVYIVNGKKVVY